MPCPRYIMYMLTFTVVHYPQISNTNTVTFITVACKFLPLRQSWSCRLIHHSLNCHLSPENNMCTSVTHYGL